MAKQYGAPDPNAQFKDQAAAGYGSDPTKKQPTISTPDESPTNESVTKFHKNASTDTRDEDIHHTIGPGRYQVARGNHGHSVGDPAPLLAGVIITGAKGGNTALASVISALVSLGAKDTTT